MINPLSDSGPGLKAEKKRTEVCQLLAYCKFIPDAGRIQRQAFEDEFALELQPDPQPIGQDQVCSDEQTEPQARGQVQVKDKVPSQVRRPWNTRSAPAA